jgi:uncharacterized protein (TIGR03435 family)
MRSLPGGRIEGTNRTLKLLIQNAFELQDFQIVGGPDWVKTDRFDVNAKAGANVPPGQGQLMMQALLADRFKLAVHKDSREAPVYALVMARNGGKPGPQLKPSECAPPTPGPQAPQAARRMARARAARANRTRSVSRAGRAHCPDPDLPLESTNRTVIALRADGNIRRGLEVGADPASAPDRSAGSAGAARRRAATAERCAGAFHSYSRAAGLKLESARTGRCPGDRPR